jgi:tetratricopeptide (TPR) repeat protein
MAKADPLYRRSLAVDERSYGPDHPVVAGDVNNLAGLLNATNRMAEAEPLMARSVRILARFQRSTGHEHPNLRIAIMNYRDLLTLQKLTEPEIDARIKAACEGTDKLSPNVLEVERLLGPAKPVEDVLASLDRQYKEQGKPAVYFLLPKEPIAPYLDGLLRPNLNVLHLLGVAAFSRGDPADAVVICEAILELVADQPAEVSLMLNSRINRAAALRELGLAEEAREELARLLPELEKTPAADSLMKGHAHGQLAVCQWCLGERAAAQKSAERSIAAYDGAPTEKPVDPDSRKQSEELLADLKAGKAPPPIAKVNARAALDVARRQYRAREALTKLGLNRPAAPLLEQILKPAKPTKEAFDSLDRQYRAQRKPAVWFLPLDQPISPHLDELFGKSSQEGTGAR